MEHVSEPTELTTTTATRRAFYFFWLFTPFPACDVRDLISDILLSYNTQFETTAQYQRFVDNLTKDCVD